MAYFGRFPVIDSYYIDGKANIGQDITRRTGFPQSVKNNPSTYIEYTVQEGETPIMLADRTYDDADLYWIILMFNDIMDINEGWPLSQVELERYVDRKYDDPQAIHHYESSYSGAIVDSDHVAYDRVSVRNVDYEVELNERKRKIKIPIPETVGNIVSEHNRLIKQ